jgi:sortase (surface protein transpeptidase)
MPLYFGSVREIAIRQRRRKRSSRRSAVATGFWRQQASVSFVLILAGVVGVAFFGSQIIKVHALEPPRTFSSTASVSTLASAALPRSEPTHITIPAIGVDAGIVPVGQDASGSIQMPPLFDWTAGWYKYSPTPGQVGPSVIVGHVDTYKGISVFWRLRELRQGDMINITRSDGRTVKFKVLALKQFDQNNFPTGEVYGNIKYPGLRLITCGGTFDQQTESYTQNTVIYAFMVV